MAPHAKGFPHWMSTTPSKWFMTMANTSAIRGVQGKSYQQPSKNWSLDHVLPQLHPPEMSV